MTAFYQVLHLIRRAFGGIKRRPWLHILSIITLAASFLSFAATLTAATNINSLLIRWVGSAEITVYLHEGSSDNDLSRLAKAVKNINGIKSIKTVSPEQARDQFVKGIGSLDGMTEILSASSFPASLEINLEPSHARKNQQRSSLAARLSKVEMVDNVEIYDDWFEKLFAISSLSKIVAWGLGLLALVVAVLVIAATVRTSVSTRKKEIQILRSVGATERYVQLPFLIEGALEAAIAMLLAQLLLHFAMNKVDTVLCDLLPLIGVGSMVRLTTTTIVAMIVGGSLAGVIGARLSLRHMEDV